MPGVCSGFLRGTHRGQGTEMETLYLVLLALEIIRLVCVVVTLSLSFGFIERNTGSDRWSDLPKVTQHGVAELDQDLCLPCLLAQGMNCCGKECDVDSRACYFS